MATGYGVGSNLNGCVLYLDASNPKSYPGAGTTWYDLSGSVYSGTLTNGPLWGAANNGIISFDGTNDYVSIPAASNLLTFGTNNFSVSFWIYLSSTSNQTIFTNYNAYNSGFSSYFFIGYFNSLAGIYILDSGGNTTSPTAVGASISQNTWTHITFTRTGTIYTCYKNGVFVNSQSDTDVNFSGSGRPILIGGGLADFGYMNGKISTLQVYNNYFTPSQALQNYLVSRGRFFGTLPFSPTDISGLQLWLDADDPRTLYSDTSGTTKATTDGTTVALWVDKSGNGRNTSQSTAASRPAIKAAFTNGRNVLNFDGSNDTLTVPSSTSTFKFLHSTASTVFIVVQYKATGTYRSYFTTASSSAHVGYIIYTNTDNTTYLPWMAGGVGGSLVSANQSVANYIDASQAYLVCCVSDPTNATAANRAIGYKNGTAPYKNNISTLTPSTANSTYDLAIGSEGNTYFANVYIAEIVVYNALLTASQRIQVETYLNNKWGLWSSFTPSSISGLTLWLDASDPASLFQNTNATTPAYQTSDYVSLWKDKSGNGNNATQATDSLRPYLVTSSQNSRNVIRFPYAAWNAATGPYMNATIGSLSAYSVFIVCKFRTSEFYSMVLTGGSSQFEVRNYSTTGYIEWNVAGSYFLRDTVSNVGNYILIELTRSGSDYTIYKNGISVATSNNASNLNIGSTIYISSRSGNSYYFDGDMAEMIIYNSAITTAQRQQVEQYLNQKWGIF